MRWGQNREVCWSPMFPGPLVNESLTSGNLGLPDGVRMRYAEYLLGTKSLGFRLLLRLCPVRWLGN